MYRNSSSETKMRKVVWVVWVVLGVLMSVCSGGAAHAICGIPPDTSDPLTCIQEVIQLYEVDARDITGSATATQKYVVFTNMENVAYQRYIVTVYDPVLAIGVIGPEPMVLVPDGIEEAEPITVQVYAGIAAGYTLNYSFDDSDLLCDVNSSNVIPSIASVGSLTGTTWGYNVLDDINTMPLLWLPAVTSTTLLQQAVAPSAIPFDEWYMAVGARAELTAPACDYENTLRFTLVGN